MNDKILSVLKDISDYNQRVGNKKNSWEVVPEFCWAKDDNYKPTFVKEVMDFVEKNGTKKQGQSSEAIRDIGQAYTIDSAILLAHFKCELVKK